MNFPQWCLAPSAWADNTCMSELSNVVLNDSDHVATVCRSAVKWFEPGIHVDTTRLPLMAPGVSMDQSFS